MSNSTTARARAIRGRWAPRRWVMLMLMAVLPMVAVLGSLSAAHADDDEDAMQYSLYKVSSSMTSFFSASQAPEGEDDGDASDGFTGEWDAVLEDPGSAGSLLGYLDPEFSASSGWLNSKLSGSSDAIGYDTLVVRDEAGNTKTSEQQGMVDYAYFGAALKGMGLDGTSTGLSLGFMNQISGFIIMLLFIMAGAVDFLFQTALSILQVINPFKLFYIGMEAINPTLAEGMVGGDSSTLGPLSGLVSWIGGWYQVLNSMAWTVMVPLFLGTLLMSLLLFKGMTRGGAVKKVVVRIAFIGLGLPLLGSMYTGVINTMSDATESGNAGATQVIMSTYVDFENWALKSRLEVPDEDAVVAWDGNDNRPTGKALSNVRNTTLAINNQTHDLGLDQIVSGGASAGDWSAKAIEGGEDELGRDEGTYSTTMDMLWRYMSNAQVSAASFETQAKGKLNQSSYYQDLDNAEDVKSWFDDYTTAEDLPSKSSDELRANPLITVQSGSGLQGTAGPGAGERTFTSNSDMCSATGTSIILGNDSAPRGCNLSPLAMFNYLNSDFGPSSMTMFSSSNVQSEATRSIHNSVNQVGTGTMGFLYWFNAVVLLGSFVVIGLGYAFSLIFANIRRSLQMITAIPFATLGSMAGIAKVIIYSMALALEVLTTLFVYKFVQEFLISLPQVIEMPFSQALNNAHSGEAAGFVTFLFAGTGFTILVTLLSIIGVLIFTVMAMRLRKSLVKAMEEAVTNLVEKFTDPSAESAGGGGKVAPAIAGGIGTGAGAAAANRMTTSGGGSSGGGAGNPLSNGKPAGPEMVSAGGTNGNDQGILTGSAHGDDDGQLVISGGGQLEVGGSAAGGNPTGPDDSGARDLGRNDSSSPQANMPVVMGHTTDDATLGREVEASGLSPDGKGHSSAVDEGSKAEDTDVMDVAADSTQDSFEGYQAADQTKVGAAKEGAEAVGHGAMAAGRGFAGDAAGAAESGGKAVEKGSKAVAASEQAKQTEKNAGRSSLDAPEQQHAKRADHAEQASRLGGQMSTVAGAAGGGKTGGVGASSAGPTNGGASKEGVVGHAGAASKQATTGSASNKATTSGKVETNTASSPKPSAQKYKASDPSGQPPRRATSQETTAKRQGPQAPSAARPSAQHEDPGSEPTDHQAPREQKEDRRFATPAAKTGLQIHSSPPPKPRPGSKTHSEEE